MLEYDEEIDAVISEREFETSEKSHGSQVIRLFSIVDETPFRKRAFFFCKKFRRRGEIRQDEPGFWSV